MTAYDWAAHRPHANEIELFTGRYLNVADPDPAAITLEDIAHGLAATCRFGGQCRYFYSVAQHAVMCSEYVTRRGHGPVLALAALHHDDAEAFLADIARPLKLLLQPTYGELTDRMDAAIRTALGSVWPLEGIKAREVKEADNWALLLEARYLLPSRGRHWGAQASAWELDLTATGHEDLWMGDMTPDEAEGWFAKRHRDLVAELRAAA